MRHAHRPALLGLLCAAALWLLVPGVASAHAHLVQADPAPDSVIAHTLTVASFLFDEPLNPALTRVRITDAAARPVTANTSHLGPDQGGTRWECCGAWVALFTTMENESMTEVDPSVDKPCPTWGLESFQ